MEIFRQQIDIESILLKNRNAIEKAIKDKSKKISFAIELWNEILTERFSLFNDDIKTIGIRLYPIIEISKNDYVHFGNPFEKIGIFIVDNESNQLKHDYREWTIYKISSSKLDLTINDFFDEKQNEFSCSTYYELEPEARDNFLNKYKLENGQVLLEYLKHKYPL